MSIKYKKSYLYLLSAWSILWGGQALASKPVLMTRSQLLMGHVPITLQIEALPKQKQKAWDASTQAYQLARNLEKQLSEYQNQSEISCLNQHAGKEACPLSPLTLQLLQRAEQIRRKTQGAFDLRFASKSLSGQRGKIILDKKQQTGRLEHPDTRLGVGAIAKGFIVDQMVELLKQQGWKKFFINAGGDLRAVGGPWTVGIQIPFAPEGNYEKKIKLKNQAIATSGTDQQGTHILDPQTQKPINFSGSVTVWARDLTTADALATAFFVLGKTKTQTLLENFPGIKVWWSMPQPPK